MKRISKEQQKEIDAQIDKLIATSGELKTTIDEFNAAMAEPRAKLEAVQSTYNDELAEMREIYDQLHTEASEYQSERSEKWNESDAGQVYAQWVDSFEGISEISDDLAIEMPEPLDVPDDLPDWENDTSFLPEASPSEI
jgi:uncharacterized coiled-coil DUF342 family protein